MSSVNYNPPTAGVILEDPQFTERLFGAPETTTAFSPSLTPAALAASIGFQEQTFTVTGLLVGDIVIVNPQVAPAANTDFTRARVSAVNTLALTFFNATAAANVPAAGVYRIAVLRN